MPSIFANVEQAPDDPILGITVAFKNDTNPDKINLGVGAYRTSEGKPLVLDVVRKVEQEMAADLELNKEYLPIEGLAEFRTATAALMLGFDSPAIKEDRVATIQALSGTGALSLAARFFKTQLNGPAVYVSDPTWGNHNKIFPVYGIEIRKYRYWDPSTRGLNFAGMIEDLTAAPDGSVVLLHACAHNPTGVDPTPEQWEKIRVLCQQKQLLPLFDSAYQGYATGDLDVDAHSVRSFVAAGMEVICAQSYAKNFGLYGERTGALVCVASDKPTAEAVLSQLKQTCVRPTFSSPPIHGARIVARTIHNPELFAAWRVELKGMADRIVSMRKLLLDELVKIGCPGDWTHITSQIGMFSFTGLTPPQVESMTRDHHIYMTKDGRISMAGVTNSNVPKLAAAMKAVVS